MTNRARELWKRLETLHAVTYFAPESHAAAEAAGLKGFWMGYFGFRAAPLGAVSAPTVIAGFANFAPSMVERAIPDAWSLASPETLVVARATAAAAALRRIDPTIDSAAAHLVSSLDPAARAGSTLGRPIYAANLAIARFDDPVAQCWQLATTLREHRGDGHVQLLSTADLDGRQALQLHAAANGTPTAVLQDNRGWSDDEWAVAADELAVRGLVLDGVLTPAGRVLHDRIEKHTDRLASAPFAVLGEQAEHQLLDRLETHATAVARSGQIPFPNPMGLPSLNDHA